jgi:hypothetical protein
MKLFARVLATVVFVTGALHAQEIVGRWTGVADTTDEAGTKRQEKQVFEIKSEDGKLAGLLVSRTGKGGIPFQVQQDGTKFNLYGFLTLDGGEHLRWKFELKGGNLVGTFSALHDNPRKWIYDRIGAMTVTRDASQPAEPAAK